MANTYEIVASNTVTTSSVASIVFSSIPNTYSDLVLKLSGRVSNTANVVDDCAISFNGSSSSFVMKRLFGDGGSPFADSGSGSFNQLGQVPNSSATAGIFGNLEVYIPNYASAQNKSFGADVVGENNASNSYLQQTTNLWSNTAAITSITLTLLSSNFLQNTTAYLYGIKNS